MSPVKYIREKARTLPIGKCYINPTWQPVGLAHIVVTRVRPSGNLVVAYLLVDTLCLGIKDMKVAHNITPEDLKEDVLDAIASTLELEEIDYVTAHNIIYGAISYAEEGGVEPPKGFDVAKFILEEDTDDIPLMDFEFGRDGKHVLYVGEDGSERKYINTLRDKLGDDLEIEACEYDGDFDDDDDCEDYREPYTYAGADYPDTLEMKHQWIADALLSSDTPKVLPDEIRSRIVDLPAGEAAADLGALLMYVIGRYRATDGEAPLELRAGLHAVVLLAYIDSNRALPALFETLRQHEDFAMDMLGEDYSDYLGFALYSAARRRPDIIIGYMMTPGYDTFMRSVAVRTLVMIIVNEPDRREEIIALLRSVMASMPDRLPRRDACDSIFATMLIYHLLDIKATELLPEIKAICDTGRYGSYDLGSYDDIVKKFGEEKDYSKDFLLPSLDEQYEIIKGDPTIH